MTFRTPRAAPETGRRLSTLAAYRAAMTSWTDLTAAAPDLADRARAVLSATTNAVLGTIRADGSPRLSGIDPFFVDGELCLGSMPGARKGADLRRDPRLALHSVPWESRRVRDGAADPGEVDVKVSGVAVALDADAVDAFRDTFGAERGMDLPPGEFFRVDLAAVTLVAVDGEVMVIDTWSTGAGRVTVRRGADDPAGR